MNSAQSILQAFKRKSGGGQPVEGRDLSNIYAGLARLPSAPAFPGPAVTPVVPLSGLKKAPHIGVIVETRRTDALHFVIANFIGQTCLPVHALLGAGNLDFKDAPPLAGYVADGMLAVSTLGSDRLAAPAYNALFLSAPLWATQAGFGKMVVFQTDSCICPASPFGLEDFTGFDYIGADWGRARPIGLVLDGGVGGIPAARHRKIAAVPAALRPAILARRRGRLFHLSHGAAGRQRRALTGPHKILRPVEFRSAKLRLSRRQFHAARAACRVLQVLPGSHAIE